MKKQSPSVSRSDQVSWRTLYQTALFETDRQMIPQRIAVAEAAILRRVKDLFFVECDHIEEDLILDDALYALRALRNCVHTASEATAA